MIFAESLKKKKKREDDIKNLKSRFDPRFTMVALNFTGVIKNDFESRVCRQPINFSTPFLPLRTASISEGRRRWILDEPLDFPSPLQLDIFTSREITRRGSGCLAAAYRPFPPSPLP